MSVNRRWEDVPMKQRKQWRKPRVSRLKIARHTGSP